MIIRLFKEAGLKIGILSNGSVLSGNAQLQETIIESVFFIRFSLSASSQETYARVHGNDNLESLTDVIRTLVKKKKQKHSPIVIGAKFLVSRHNWPEIASAARLAKELEADYLHYKLLRDPANELAGEDLDKARKLVAEAKTFSGEEYRVLGTLSHTVLEKRCQLNPLRVVVNSDGEVYLCAFFPHRQKTHSFGNIKKQPLTDIWFSPEHLKVFRENDPKLCNYFDCPFHLANKLVRESIWQTDKLHLDFI